MNSVFVYNGNEICFQKGDGSVMVNATEMAKAFDKRPSKWLELPSTKEFLDTLSNVRKSDTSIIQTLMGSPENGGGTWMHEDVALEFARWLSPAFAIWCNDRIKDLLKNGYTKLDTITRKDLAKMLFESEEEKERLQIRNAEQQKALEEQAPKVLFADTVSASSSSILVGELAKLICQRGVEIGQNRLFDWMRRNGYLLSRQGEYYNRPAQRYIEQGLFELKKTSITRGDGTILVTTTTKVTGKGQVYFVDKFLGSFAARDMLKNVNSEKITA